MTLRIHGIARSRAIRAIWTAEECGVAYEHVPVGWADGGTRAPSYLALNPNGTVPTIEDGGLVLWESLAIDLYLAKKYGKDLYPASAEDEARVWQWTLFAANEVERHTGAYTANTWMKPPAERDPKAAEAALKALARPFAVLEAKLARSPWLVGSAFSVADLNLAGVLLAWRLNKFDFSPWPRLDDWLARCFARPAARKAIALRTAA